MRMTQLTLSRQRFWPSELFRDGTDGWFYCADAATLFTDAAGTDPVDAVDDYVGRQIDLSGNGYHATQATSTSRPQYKGVYSKYDLTDDMLTKTSPTISDGTIAIITNVGAWFESFSCSAGAFYHGPTSYTGGPDGLFSALKAGVNDYREIGHIVIDREFTADEKTNLLGWAWSFGCPGEFSTYSPEELTDIDFNSKLLALPPVLSALGATFSCSTPRYVIQDGLLVKVAADQFATHYDYVTGKYNLLAESTSTNLVTHSEALTDFNTVSGMTLTGGQSAPDGTNNAWLVTTTKAISYKYKTLTGHAAGAYTISYFTKRGSSRYISCAITHITNRYAIYDFDTNSFTGQANMAAPPIAEVLGGGWVRISIRVNVTTAVVYIPGPKPCQSGVSTATLVGATTYWFGSQIEAGIYCSSYIQTTGATYQRGSSALQIPLSSIPLFSSLEYTLRLTGRFYGTDTSQRFLLSISDQTNANRFFIRANSGNYLYTAAYAGGVLQHSETSASFYSNSQYRIAISLKANQFLRAINGVSGTADIEGDLPISPNTLYIGANNLGSGSANSLISNVQLITRGLEQASLNLISLL